MTSPSGTATEQGVRKKICLLGSFAVGKTSLVRRFVHSIFSERYLTTVGVRIEKKSLELGGRDLHLVVWDLSGEDEFNTVQISYLRGASGYLLVADGTRPETLETAQELRSRVERELGTLPVVLVLNKSDLEHEWTIDPNRPAQVAASSPIVRTSAKTGAGVEEAFVALARQVMGN